MRKRATAPQASAPALTAPTALPALTAIPAGYAILPFGRDRFRPVLIVSGGGDGLWSKPVYRELRREDDTQAAVYRTSGEALTLIAAHQQWKRQQQADAAADARRAKREQEQQAVAREHLPGVGKLIGKRSGKGGK